MKMVSEEIQNVINFLKRFKEEVPPDFSLQGIRDLIAGIVPKFLPDDILYKQIDAGGVPAIWVETPGANPNNVIVHYHGGGGIAGTAQGDVEFCGRLSRETGARILSVDYRLGPENPFPAGIDDALAAYKWVLSIGIRPDHVILEGVSKGAQFSLVTLLQARDAGVPLPAAGILVSPDTDVNFIFKGIGGEKEEDPLLPLEMLKLLEAQYVGTTDRDDPRVSPYLADLSGLPPLLIQASSKEVLLADAKRFTKKAREQGVDVQLDVIEGAIHGMVLLTSFIPEVVKAMGIITAFVKKIFGQAGAHPSPKKVVKKRAKKPGKK